MLRILGITRDLKLLTDIQLNALVHENIMWYWVDFNEPTEQEAKLLAEHFHFHTLAIEDCLHLLQRPKLDHYGDTHFLVLHSIHPNTLKAEEVDLFLENNFIVTFHLNPSEEIDEVWNRICEQQSVWEKGHLYAAYLVMDNLVDQYFPAVEKLEDQLSEFESKERKAPIQTLMNDIFETRAKLLKLHKTIWPMRDLLYRIINTEQIEGMKEQLGLSMILCKRYFPLTEDTVEHDRENVPSIGGEFVPNFVLGLSTFKARPLSISRAF